MQESQRPSLKDQLQSQIKCLHCLHSQVMLERFSRLVDLLNKKIAQLTKKLKQRQGNNGDQMDGEKIGSDFKQRMKLGQNVDRQINLTPIPIFQETDRLNKNDSTRRDSMGTATQQFWKGNSLVNNLTEEILQLKSNFMHIRQCLYSLFQQSKMWNFIKKSETGTNIAMVLFNIFEFSQSEREEMFRRRKVRMRTLDQEEGQTVKENTYITVKHICT